MQEEAPPTGRLRPDKGRRSEDTKFFEWKNGRAFSVQKTLVGLPSDNTRE
jgi:hypothetical protein